jgi:predicted AAA+ superfamily ATPase
MAISRESVLKALGAFNPWWRTGMIHPYFTKKYRRFAYHEAVKSMIGTVDDCEVTIMSGVRGAGKTTILYQMIETLLRDGVPPQRILYAPLDHTILKLAGLDELQACYQEYIHPGPDAYFFLDEVEYEPDWDMWLDATRDDMPGTKVMATKSAGEAIRVVPGSAREKWNLINIFALSFYEYCCLVGVDIPKIPTHLINIPFSSMEKQEQSDVISSLFGFQNYFGRYLMVGGFPETALSKNDAASIGGVRESVVNKSLKEDLPSIYNIRNTTELERIFFHLCGVSSDIVSVDAIAKNLRVASRPTVENYIRYMDGADLIYVAHPLEVAQYKIQKSSPKIYISDAAIRGAILMDDSVQTSPSEMGRIVEAVVYRHVLDACRKKGFKAGYLRGETRDRGIDIVVDRPGRGNILIEVKYDDDSRIDENDVIYEMASQSSDAIVVTRNAGDYGLKKTPSGKAITRIPAYAFLYLMSVTPMLS